MKVRELMTTNIGFCGPRTNAGALADILWTRDCGAAPIVDEQERLLGIVTDRDLCIALGTRNCRAQDLFADEVMTKDVSTCSPEDDVLVALRIMQNRKVRRVPVVDGDRRLLGLLSIYDVIQKAARGNGSAPFSAGAVVSAMAHIAERAPAREPEFAGARASR